MHASEILRHIRAVFARMEDGTFGECVQCGEAISQKRLAALPGTPNCIRCQERIGRQQLDTDRVSARLTPVWCPVDLLIATALYAGEAGIGSFVSRSSLSPAGFNLLASKL